MIIPLTFTTGRSSVTRSSTAAVLLNEVLMPVTLTGDGESRPLRCRGATALPILHGTPLLFDESLKKFQINTPPERISSTYTDWVGKLLILKDVTN